MKGSKIFAAQALRRIVRSLKKKKKIVVFTNGCFDLVHAGHVRYLKKARALGDVLIVGVNTDASVRQLKGIGRPLVNLAHRMEMLSALESVNYVVPFGEQTPETLVRKLEPTVLVKGADYAQNQIAGASFVKNSGGRVVRIALVGGLSTTALLAKIRASSLSKAQPSE